MSKQRKAKERPPMPEGLDCYKPSERLIYKYWDGEKEVLADPIVLYRRIMSKAAELDADMSAAKFPGFEKAEEAHASLVSKLQKLFKVRPMAEGGLTDTQLEELLDHFLAYCDWLKKKPLTTPTCVGETSASSDSSSVENPATTNMSASGSTESEPSTALPTPLPSDTPLPTAQSSQAWSIGATLATEKESL